MGNMRTVSRSFSGGEIAPEMFGRIDDVKYQSGAALLNNFIVNPQGPAERRPGLAYVNSTKSNGVARLLPFTYSNEQTMVIELGPGYFRFHTQGETLIYPTVAPAWVAPSDAITISLSTPAIVTWAGHGLSTGDPIVFYLYGGTQASELPSGLQVGYKYTVQVIDANSFNVLDGGSFVNLPPVGSGGTTYTGSGTTSVSASCGEDDFDNEISTTLTGLASHVIAGGFANLSVTADASAFAVHGTAEIDFQYSTGGAWMTFYTVTRNGTVTNPITAQIPIANSNLLQLRIEATVEASLKGSASATGSISEWSLTNPSGSDPTTFAGVRAYRYYSAGEAASYGGDNYSAAVESVGGRTVPGTDATVWHVLPADQIYEIKNSYAEADLFDIHYVQSADVLTLVHPNYPPSELRRMGATAWAFQAIQFTQALSAPSGVAVAASPGFIVGIASESGGVYTTVSNHTLAYGDPVYVTAAGGTLASGFYLVSDVPVDGMGDLIKNQLSLMDYDGNAVTGTVSGSPTIQFGGKIFDITNYYVVTALTSDGVNESPVSLEVSVLDNLNVPGSFNTLTWMAVNNAAQYYVYKKKNGLYGYIGQTPTTSFSDNNIAPDFSITPPIFDPIFTGAGDYPGAVSYFDQRRCFAGTTNRPQDMWMSKVGTESDFSYSLPVKDTDRIYFRVATRERSAIRHIVPMTQLLQLTSSCEIRISPVNSDALTPSNVSAKPQSYVGASNVQPSVINNSLVYCAARGGHVREMGYAWTSNGWVTGDLSLRAKHLFDNLTILDQCYVKAPTPIVWFVSSSGQLIGLTYIPEEQIGAWHHHTTDGFFESITAVAEGDEDRLYAVVRRTINGSTVRYIERMAPRLFASLADCFFVDAGSTYDGAPTSTIAGLDWLEGETVEVLADGAVQLSKTVTGGAIALDRAASKVQVGLPFTPDMETLPLMLQIDGAGQGRMKNINKVWLKVNQSSGIFAGPDADHLVEYPQRTTETYGTPPNLVINEIEIVLTPAWAMSGKVHIRQTGPLPLEVVGITMEVAAGG